jgi:hypothetical protein
LEISGPDVPENQLIANGGLPPEGLTEALPSFPPKQDTLLISNTFNMTGQGIP